MLCLNWKVKTFRNDCKPCYLLYEHVKWKDRKHKCKIKPFKPNEMEQMCLENNENSDGGNSSHAHVKKVKK